MSGYHGAEYSSVQEALNAAIKHAKEDDLIFVGGSTFVVADLNI
jgi:dihydrofolate synthase/folylpolyglutamate synthase